jgi:hypothetical protein
MSRHRTFYLLRFFVIVLLLGIYQPSVAQDYPSGHQALEIFDEAGMAAAPTWVQYWVFFMLATFAAGLLFVWRQPVARWVVGGFVLGMVFLMAVAPALEIVPLSGFIALCHIIFWSPGLYQLLRERPFLKDKSPFAIWSGLMTAVILFSFVFDLRDAAIYLNHIL